MVDSLIFVREALFSRLSLSLPLETEVCFRNQSYSFSTLRLRSVYLFNFYCLYLHKLLYAFGTNKSGKYTANYCIRRAADVSFYDRMELAILQVFRAFGWMIPAVVISLIMGTGPNGIVMSLALPLAQSAISLAAETLLGRADEAPRPRKRPNKKRPFTGGQRRTRVRNEIRSQTRKEAENNYKSWFEGNNVSSTKERNWQDFGGWDELDRQVRSDQEPRTTSVEQRDDEPRAGERLKISRRRKGDSQLFMRFLIAMFPFLGFWTKLF